MIDTSNLPYWASEYIKHIYDNLPDTYDELLESGELEKTALSIQESANTFYEQQIAYHTRQGVNPTTAEILADSAVMRTYICVPPEDEYDEELDAIVEDFDAIARQEAYEDAIVTESGD